MEGYEEMADDTGECFGGLIPRATLPLAAFLSRVKCGCRFPRRSGTISYESFEIVVPLVLFWFVRYGRP